MYKVLVTVLAASLGLTEWASVAAADLFSKTGPVIAIMANDLFLGEGEGHLSGAGTIAVRGTVRGQANDVQRRATSVRTRTDLDSAAL